MVERDGDPSNPREPSQQAAFPPTSARAVGSGSGLRHAGPGNGLNDRISDPNLKFADNFQVEIYTKSRFL